MICDSKSSFPNIIRKKIERLVNDCACKPADESKRSRAFSIDGSSTQDESIRLMAQKISEYQCFYLMFRPRLTAISKEASRRMLTIQ